MTQLSVIPASDYMALSNSNEEMAEALEAMAEVGETFGPSDLTRVPIPSGGSTKWMIPTIAGDEPADAITGVLCHVQRRGVLWPSDNPTPDAKPVLVSWDLKTAEQVGPIPDEMLDTLERHRINDRQFNWESLPFNQFGTSKNGQGKRCKEQRMLYILRQGDLYPLLVTAQPGSLQNVRKFLLGLPQAGIPYWQAIVELRLEKASAGTGEPYSRIVPKLVGRLSREDGAIVKEKYSDVLKSVALQVDPDEASESDE